MFKLALAMIFALGFTSTALASHHEEKSGVKKAAESNNETKTAKDQQAEADAALKKIEAMTPDRGKKKDKKDDKK